MEPTPMSTYLTTLQAVGTALISLMGDVVTFIMASGHEFILVPFGVILLTSAIAEIRRLV